MSELERVKLRGGLDRTASWVYVTDDGTLVTELYDFSPDAEKWLGNDVAFLLHVAAADKARVLSALRGEAFATGSDRERDAALLESLRERFDDYYAVKEWLDQRGIAYRKEFEPWA
ncbi:MAG TPA: hypothetical protein VGX96_20125 [Candidatus Elarobacter sp.]|nr:hypothetical protein [Candidatus Elarobacter sp.]